MLNTRYQYEHLVDSGSLVKCNSLPQYLTIYLVFEIILVEIYLNIRSLVLNSFFFSILMNPFLTRHKENFPYGIFYRILSNLI